MPITEFGYNVICYKCQSPAIWTHWSQSVSLCESHAVDFLFALRDKIDDDLRELEAPRNRKRLDEMSNAEVMIEIFGDKATA